MRADEMTRKSGYGLDAMKFADKLSNLASEIRMGRVDVVQVRTTQHTSDREYSSETVEFIYVKRKTPA